MATYYETTTVFNFNWKQVAQAFWNRYPNPASTHVLTEDTIKREIIDGKLFTRRLLSKTNPVPKWGERFFNAKSVKIIEDSILDPVKKTLITYTRNVGFKKVLRVDEKVEYVEQDDGTTLAIRSAWISSQVFGFSRAIRAFGVERFKSNCNKTVTGFNFVLNKMFPTPIRDHLYHASLTEQHHPQQKTPKLKDAGRGVYDQVKRQANKLYQIFSIKH